MTPITALGSRSGIQGALGRSVKRAAAGGGWWDLNGTITSCVAAYQPKGAASYAASKVNLTGNTDYDATEGTAPDWDSTNGWDFVTAENKVLTTGISVTDNMSIIIRFSDAKSTGDNYLFGLTAQSTNKEYWLAPNNQYFAKIKYARWDRQDSVSSKIASGVLALSTNSLYINGDLDVTAGSGTTPSANIIIGRQKPTYGQPVAKIQAMAIYNAALTEQNISDLTTAMAAL